MADETEAKSKLLAVADSLREVHRALVGAARAEYEKESGPAGGPGQMLKLLTEHPSFAWLHTMSELIVDLDSLLAQSTSIQIQKGSQASTSTRTGAPPPPTGCASACTSRGWTTTMSR